MADRVNLQSKRKPPNLRQMCVDHSILLFNHLFYHVHFITNGYKRFSKTNSTDPRQRVPLTQNDITLHQDELKMTFLHSFKLSLCYQTEVLENIVE